YQTLNAEIERVADEKGDLLLVRNPELDEEKQSQQIDYFRQQKVNVIVINPVKGDSPKIIASLKRAREAGIKIIAVDSQLSHFTVDASVVSDNYQAGVLVAQRLMKQKNEAKILLLEHKGTVSAEQRIRVLRYHSVGSSYQVVGREETRGQTELALPAVSRSFRMV
ncbi:MAG: substrate-binding domain-containing protein, partial [Streptococcus sp.]